MMFVVYTKDRKDHGHVRAAHREAHLAYLQTYREKIWASGGLFPEESSLACGGMIIIDLADHADADRFVAEDPFVKAGLFERVEVNMWKRSFEKGRFFPIPLLS